MNLNDNKLLLFPNPGTDIVNLKFPNNSMDKAEISIYDESLRKVSTHSLKQIYGSTDFSINIEQLSAGIYFMNVEGSSVNQTYKFIKR